MLVKVAWHSLRNRRTTVALTILSVAVGVFTLLGVEHIRQHAKTSFNSTVSGIDLIVGARTSPINLLLYSTFRIGDATNNIHWDSYQHFAEHPQVAWTVPIVLGDSHRGYRVMGTSATYFEHFRYGKSTALSFTSGGPFKKPFDVVLGAEIARQLDYPLASDLVLAHGLGHTSFSLHNDHPFTVAGILAPTGTPVDRTLFVPLAGIDAIHGGHTAREGGGHVEHGQHESGHEHHESGHDHHQSEHKQHRSAHEQSHSQSSQPTSITAFMLGLTSKAATFSVQRQINQYESEPLSAILPGVALTQLWQMMSSVERVLQLISLMVFVASMLGLSAMLMASMRERRREMAVLRAIGAGPAFIFLILQTEAVLIVVAGTLLALATLQLGLPLADSILAQHFGLLMEGHVINTHSLNILALVLLATVLVGLIPSLSAYRQSLHSGLAQRQ